MSRRNYKAFIHPYQGGSRLIVLGTSPDDNLAVTLGWIDVIGPTKAAKLASFVDTNMASDKQCNNGLYARPDKPHMFKGSWRCDLILVKDVNHNTKYMDGIKVQGIGDSKPDAAKSARILCDTVNLFFMRHYEEQFRKSASRRKAKPKVDVEKLEKRYR